MRLPLSRPAPADLPARARVPAAAAADGGPRRSRWRWPGWCTSATSSRHLRPIDAGDARSRFGSAPSGSPPTRRARRSTSSPRCTTTARRSGRRAARTSPRRGRPARRCSRRGSRGRAPSPSRRPLRAPGRDLAGAQGHRPPLRRGVRRRQPDPPASADRTAFGFPGAIAHGMWTKARSLAALDARLPDALTADVTFLRPLPLPSVVRFVARPTADRLGVRRAAPGGRTAAPDRQRHAGVTDTAPPAVPPATVAVGGSSGSTPRAAWRCSG